MNKKPLKYAKVVKSKRKSNVAHKKQVNKKIDEKDINDADYTEESIYDKESAC